MRSSHSLQVWEVRRFNSAYDETDLKEQIDDLFHEIYRAAEIRNCVVDDITLTNDATKQG